MKITITIETDRPRYDELPKWLRDELRNKRNLKLPANNMTDADWSKLHDLLKPKDTHPTKGPK